MKNLKRVPLAAIFALFCVLRCFGQDEPVPKPKPKPATSGKTAKKPDSGSAAQPPAPAVTLLVMCDLACNWKLDGVAQGVIAADSSAKVRIELGQHSISAVTADGPDQLRQDIEIKQTGQTIVHMDLTPIRASRLQQASEQATRTERARKEQEEAARRLWADPSTGLEWTKKDNGDGNDLTWQQAMDYCRNLQLAGHGDWRLPTIDELQGIYDASVNVPGSCCNGQAVTWHVKGNLQLSGGHWSSSPGNASGEAWHFGFYGGGRGSHRLGDSFFKRALCVRRSGE